MTTLEPYGVDRLIALWRKREKTYARAGMPGMAATARRYREALERFAELIPPEKSGEST